MSAVMREPPPQRRRDPDETRIASIFLDAQHRGASGAELDYLHSAVNCEHRVRRAALELSQGTIDAENVHLIEDLLRHALRLAVRV